jgi:capsular polysaccharide biosynthesis protein
MSIPVGRRSNNGLLIFFITAIFMVLIAFLAFFYVTNTTNFETIKKNQQNGQQSRNSQNQDLVSISCSLWEAMSTSPYVKPSPSTVQQMTELCG